MVAAAVVVVLVLGGGGGVGLELRVCGIHGCRGV